jgi:hypothetical protein
MKNGTLAEELMNHCNCTLTSVARPCTFSSFAMIKDDLAWLPKLSMMPDSKIFQICLGIAKQMAL